MDVTNSVPSGLPSGNLPDPSRMRLFSYLLTGLLTDLLTEAHFTAYGPAYGGCLWGLLTALASTTFRGPQLVASDPAAAKAGIEQFHKVKYLQNGMFRRG